MTPRAAKIAHFLDAAGWGQAQRAPLAGDASNRRYERLTQGPKGAGAVLMDAPPEKGEDTRPFVAIATYLAGIGLSAPRILAQDNAAGLLLLEDLGDDLFARVVADGRADETALYTAAVDALVDLHQNPPPADLAAYSPELMTAKAALAGQWYRGGCDDCPAVDPANPAAKAISDAIAPLLARYASDTPVLVLRDFHAENLIWLPVRTGTARVGLLDFQDALRGHPAYDLVSLLEDARRDVPPALQDAMLAHYITRSGTAPDPFRRAYALLGAQRNLRILGVFARLSLHFGKPGYVDLIPRVWGHLQNDLSHPDLGSLAAAIAAHLPPPDRDRLDRLRDRCATIQTL